jgi:hypothetical protein
VSFLRSTQCDLRLNFAGSVCDRCGWVCHVFKHRWRRNARSPMQRGLRMRWRFAGLCRWRTTLSWRAQSQSQTAWWRCEETVSRSQVNQSHPFPAIKHSMSQLYDCSLVLCCCCCWDAGIRDTSASSITLSGTADVTFANLTLKNGTLQRDRV